MSDDIKPGIKYPKPIICCFDVEAAIIESLIADGYNIFNGSLGTITEVYNQEGDPPKKVLLDHIFPDNIHECDIFIIDQTSPKKKSYRYTEQVAGSQHNYRQEYLITKYPASLFNPIPYASALLGEKLAQIQNKEVVLIVFAGKNTVLEYHSIVVTDNAYTKNQVTSKGVFSSYSFLNRLPIGHIKKGLEMTVCETNNINLNNFLRNSLTDSCYEQTFTHPFDGFSLHQKFYPLIRNSSDEIVSFIDNRSNPCVFTFPNINNKQSFLKDFLNSIIPSLSPNLFPYSTAFNWKDNREYYLPNHKGLMDKKEKLILEYENNLNILNTNIEHNKLKFSFLHDILTETGEELVHAIEHFLKWLGFESVIIMDEFSQNTKEEDIQVKLPEGLLIIETKGINGTSTDSNCSQISKIKHRRCKERNTFDVWALYIVNHQRSLPPLKRTNPPFTKHQITDAENDERGLLSTWQLFCLYQDIDAGIITKDKARTQLLDYGLIRFTPSLGICLGKPKELHMKNTVCIMDITTSITQNEDIFIELDGRFQKAQIVSIQANNVTVKTTSSCEAGIKLNIPITQNAILWKKA